MSKYEGWFEALPDEQAREVFGLSIFNQIKDQVNPLLRRLGCGPVGETEFWDWFGARLQAMAANVLPFAEAEERQEIDRDFGRN